MGIMAEPREQAHSSEMDGFKWELFDVKVSWLWKVVGTRGGEVVQNQTAEEF